MAPILPPSPMSQTGDLRAKKELLQQYMALKQSGRIPFGESFSTTQRSDPSYLLPLDPNQALSGNASQFASQLPPPIGGSRPTPLPNFRAGSNPGVVNLPHDPSAPTGMVNLSSNASLPPPPSGPQKGIIPSLIENQIRGQMNTATALPRAIVRGGSAIANKYGPPAASYAKGVIQGAAQNVDAGSRKWLGDTITDVGERGLMAAGGARLMLPFMRNSPQESALPPPPQGDGRFQRDPSLAPYVDDLNTLLGQSGEFQPPRVSQQSPQLPPPPQDQGSVGSVNFSNLPPPLDTGQSVSQGPRGIPSRFVQLPDGSYTSRAFQDHGGYSEQILDSEPQPEFQPEYMGQLAPRDLWRSRKTINPTEAMDPLELPPDPNQQRDENGFPIPFVPGRDLPSEPRQPGRIGAYGQESFVGDQGDLYATEGEVRFSNQDRYDQNLDKFRDVNSKPVNPSTAAENRQFELEDRPIEAARAQLRAAEQSLEAAAGVLKGAGKLGKPDPESSRAYKQAQKAHQTAVKAYQEALTGGGEQQGASSRPADPVSAPTQDDVDRLPSGIEFIFSDGKKYKKQ